MTSSREVQWTPGDKGESYGLVFSFRAMQALKDAWKCKDEQEVGEKLQALENGMDLSKVVDIIWAAMRTKHREKTQDDVLDILDALGFEALGPISELLSTLIAASMPTARPPAVATAGTPGQ